MFWSLLYANLDLRWRMIEMPPFRAGHFYSLLFSVPWLTMGLCVNHQLGFFCWNCIKPIGLSGRNWRFSCTEPSQGWAWRISPFPYVFFHFCFYIFVSDTILFIYIVFKDTYFALSGRWWIFIIIWVSACSLSVCRNRMDILLPLYSVSTKPRVNLFEQCVFKVLEFYVHRKSHYIHVPVIIVFLPFEWLIQLNVAIAYVWYILYIYICYIFCSIFW